MNEELTVFGSSNLSGIFSDPSDLPASSLPGVVLLSPGLLHRVGPHRVYVKLARTLAAEGHHVLRFDFSGQGESPKRTDQLPILESRLQETRLAIDHLLERIPCSHVLLMGHCSGALIALAAAFGDERIAGIVAISPEGGDQDWVEFDRKRKEARYYANYYSKSAMADSSRWKRLLTGRADYGSIIRNVFRTFIWHRLSVFVYRLRTATGQTARDAEERADVREYKQGLASLAERRVPILLIHPDQSAGPEMLRALLGNEIEQLNRTGVMQTRYIQNSDHMFTPLAAQRTLISMIRDWTLDQARSSASADFSTPIDRVNADPQSSRVDDDLAYPRSAASG